MVSFSSIVMVSLLCTRCISTFHRGRYHCLFAFASGTKASASARIDSRWAVAIIYLLFVALIVLLFWLFGARAIDQFSTFVAQRREIVTNLISQISTAFNWQLDVEQSTNEILSSIEQNFGTPGEIVHLGALVSKGMLAVLVTVVSSIYFIVDSKRVGEFFLRFVPAKTSKRLSIYHNR